MRVVVFNDTATTEIYTRSLHDALPICHEVPQGPPLGRAALRLPAQVGPETLPPDGERLHQVDAAARSEEHTSELQSRQYLVCRLLLEKNTPMTSTSRPCRTRSSSPTSL